MLKLIYIHEVLLNAYFPSCLKLVDVVCRFCRPFFNIILLNNRFLYTFVVFLKLIHFNFNLDHYLSSSILSYTISTYIMGNLEIQFVLLIGDGDYNVFHTVTVVWCFYCCTYQYHPFIFGMEFWRHLGKTYRTFFWRGVTIMSWTFDTINYLGIANLWQN